MEQEKRKRGRPRKPPMPKNKEYLKRMDEEIAKRAENGKIPKSLVANRHFSLDPDERHPARMAQGFIKDKFEKREQLIDDVIDDIVNGVPRNEVMSKLENGTYQTGVPMLRNERYKVMKCALMRLRWNREATYEEHRDILWTRYENLYKMALDERDLGEARKCLSDMSRIFGLDADRTMEMTKVDDGKVVIRFGFNPQEEPQDVEAEDITDAEVIDTPQIEYNEIEAPF